MILEAMEGCQSQRLFHPIARHPDMIQVIDPFGWQEAGHPRSRLVV